MGAGRLNMAMAGLQTAGLGVVHSGSLFGMLLVYVLAEHCFMMTPVLIRHMWIHHEITADHRQRDVRCTLLFFGSESWV